MLKLKRRITIGSRVRGRCTSRQGSSMYGLGTVRGAAYMKDGNRYIRVEWDNGDETIVRERELKLVRIAGKAKGVGK